MIIGWLGKDLKGKAEKERTATSSLLATAVGGNERLFHEIVES
ncbi:hypothetical protein P2G85_16370 [Vibrio sp. CAU 1672]|nr:hypothetical protein [Vibrio sp. CAU 1672]